ncbi:MAG: hypothetical protein ACFB51_11170 [Anaerolineae bacterium]
MNASTETISRIRYPVAANGVSSAVYGGSITRAGASARMRSSHRSPI